MKVPHLYIKQASLPKVLGSGPCPDRAQVKLRRMVDALFAHAHANGIAMKLEIRIPEGSPATEGKAKP